MFYTPSPPTFPVCIYVPDSLQVDSRKNGRNLRIGGAHCDQVTAVVIDDRRFRSEVEEEFDTPNFAGQSCFDQRSLPESVDSIGIGAILEE